MKTAVNSLAQDLLLFIFMMKNPNQEFDSAEKTEAVQGSRGWVNCPQDSTPDIVLVEDDDLVRGVWLTVALRMQFKFATYASPEAFLEDLYLFADGTKFYLDQDFGYRRGLGLQLSKAIRKVHEKSKVFLVTSYPRKSFSKEISIGVLDEVYGKYPWPFTINNAMCL